MRLLKSASYVAALLTLSVLLSMVVPGVVDWVPEKGKAAPRQESTDRTVNDSKNAAASASVGAARVDPRPPREAAAEPAPADITECTALPLSAFGDAGHAAGRASVPGDGSVCYTVTAERPGLHRILLDRHRGDSHALVFDGARQLDCYDASGGAGWCALPRAGVFTVKVVNYGSARSRTALAAVSLADTTGCRTQTGTSWTTPAVTGSLDSALELLCQPFRARPGDRVVVDFSADQWITDRSGARICPRTNADGSDGCVLPGDGPYRVIARIKHSEAGFPAAYALSIRRLSDPSGCGYAPLNAYDSPPAAATASGCKIFSAPTAGSFEIHQVSAAGVRSGVKVYDRTGRTVCKPWGQCQLPESADYTLVTDQATLVYDRTASDGCRPAVLGGQLGDFGAAGETDCLILPEPAGARLAALGNRGAVKVDPKAVVLDADGTQRCDWATLNEGTCGLTGKAPHRMLITAGQSNQPTGAYAMALYRTDTAEGCTTVPAGDFTATTAAAHLTTGGGVFSHCLTIPAGDHSVMENLQLHTATGTSNAVVTVVDPTGTKVCALRPVQYAHTTCGFTPGAAYTVIFSAEDTDGSYTLTRRDVTATAKGCIPNPATVVGGPSATATAGAAGTLQCRQVTTEDPKDTLYLNARDEQATAHTVAHGADGAITTCGYRARACAVTGSTSYQVIVTVPQDRPAAPDYRFDALRIGTAAGPAPECLRIPNVSYGFGALTGTLTEQNSAVCAALPTGTSDQFNATVTSDTGVAERGLTVVPRLYGSALENGCTTTRTGRYRCTTDEPTTAPLLPTTLVIGLPERASQTSYRAAFDCRASLCGNEPRTVGTIGPATAVSGSDTVLTLTGTALHQQDTVRIKRSGKTIESTPISVAPDRRSLTVALDLDGAAPGTWTASVITHYGWEFGRGAFIVTPGVALKNTKAPRISGTVRAGAKVTAVTGGWTPVATAHRYQWKADGRSISGATSSTYTVPSSLVGKQLTVSVTARRIGHPDGSATSAPTTVALGGAPKASKSPRITGTADVGRTLKAKRGTWSPKPTSYAYQWYADGRAIVGATGSSLKLKSAQGGKKITVKVTAQRTGHQIGSSTSRATDSVDR
ncbi:hypothetical protein ACFQ61_00530 [Streptomyces sp. NPDC056500]|uniref:hypothetical protein n=1 Tax=Streptomyces sp. NPDC056500 TaxID=3345840 RepID=UPI0036D13688